MFLFSSALVWFRYQPSMEGRGWKVGDRMKMDETRVDIENRLLGTGRAWTTLSRWIYWNFWTLSKFQWWILCSFLFFFRQIFFFSVFVFTTLNQFYIHFSMAVSRSSMKYLFREKWWRFLHASKMNFLALSDGKKLKHSEWWWGRVEVGCGREREEKEENFFLASSGKCLSWPVISRRYWSTLALTFSISFLTEVIDCDGCWQSQQKSKRGAAACCWCEFFNTTHFLLSSLFICQWTSSLSLVMRFQFYADISLHIIKLWIFFLFRHHVMCDRTGNSSSQSVS